MDLRKLPTVDDLPWVHVGNGVIRNSRKQTLGAFERAATAAAVVALVNALSEPPPTPDNAA